MKNNSEDKSRFKGSGKEIDLIELTKKLWHGRKLLIQTAIIFTVFGLSIAILTPKEFTASTTLIPQTSGSQNNLGGLSSLASMAGFNLDLSQGASDISPQIYPQIIQSVPFQLEIMNTPFTFSDVEDKMTLFEYYIRVYKPGILETIKKYTIGISGVIREIKGGKEEFEDIQNNNETPVRLTKKQDEIRKIISKNLSLSVNDKQGYVELSSRFFEPELAAQVTQKAKDLLQKTITEFKIEKATAQLQFIEERYNEKKKEFEEVQEKLAAFRDRNKNVTSAIALTQEEQLQNEYQLAFNVYSELAQQLEQAQIKVKEDTPVFSTIKPVVVPIEKSKPNRLFILIVWIFLGVLLGPVIIFVKGYWTNVKMTWTEK